MSNEIQSTTPAYRKPKPKVYIPVAIGIALIAAFATSGPKKAEATNINTKLDTPPIIINTKASDTPSLSDPKPDTQENATATQESKAIRTGNVTNNGPGNVTIINGNQYNITVNPPAPEKKTQRKLEEPAPLSKSQNSKAKTPCDDHLTKHTTTVTAWKQLVN